jgi:hypothetical protein
MTSTTEANVSKRNVKSAAKNNSAVSAAPAATSSKNQAVESTRSPASVSNEEISLSSFNLTGVKTLLTVVALACICVTGFMVRLFSVIRYESIIHEFDPWSVPLLNKKRPISTRFSVSASVRS